MAILSSPASSTLASGPAVEPGLVPNRGDPNAEEYYRYFSPHRHFAWSMGLARLIGRPLLYSITSTWSRFRPGRTRVRMTRALNPEYLTRLYQVINESPFPSHLPMRVTEMTLDTSRVELGIAACHMQPFGIVHGGVIATLIDTATFWAGFGPLPEDSGLVNVDLKLNYLEAATKGMLIATGRRIRTGRTTSYTEAYVRTEEGRLVAHGTSTLMALPGKGIPVGVPKFL